MMRRKQRYTYRSLMLHLHLWYLYKVFGTGKFKVNKFDTDW